MAHGGSWWLILAHILAHSGSWCLIGWLIVAHSGLIVAHSGS